MVSFESSSNLISVIILLRHEFNVNCNITFALGFIVWLIKMNEVINSVFVD